MRHEMPKPAKLKKAAPRKPRKRPAKVVVLIAPLEAVEQHGSSIVLDSCPPAEVPDERLPVISTVFYVPDAEPVEPHHVVLEIAGKKSLWKRWCDWIEN